MKQWFGIGVAALGLALAMPAHAQGTKKQLQGYIAGGYVLAEGDTGDYFDDGWDISGGVIWRFGPERPLALRVDLGYNWFDANARLLDLARANGLRVDDGNMSLGTLTVEILYEFGGGDRVGGYVAAGVGGMRRYAELTTSVTVPGYICDPWWGWCVPGLVPGDVIAGSDTLTKWEYSVGGGVTFPTGAGEFYVEARYHWMDSDPSTEMLPILVGYRF